MYFQQLFPSRILDGSVSFPDYWLILSSRLSRQLQVMMFTQKRELLTSRISQRIRHYSRIKLQSVCLVNFIGWKWKLFVTLLRWREDFLGQTPRPLVSGFFLMTFTERFFRQEFPQYFWLVFLLLGENNRELFPEITRLFIDVSIGTKQIDLWSRMNPYIFIRGRNALLSSILMETYEASTQYFCPIFFTSKKIYT